MGWDVVHIPDGVIIPVVSFILGDQLKLAHIKFRTAAHKSLHLLRPEQLLCIVCMAQCVLLCYQCGISWYCVVLCGIVQYCV